MARKDLLYEWQFPDGEIVLTTSPVMSKIFRTAGRHVININASNSGTYINILIIILKILSPTQILKYSP